MSTVFHKNKEFRRLVEHLDVEIRYSQKGMRYFLRHSPFGRQTEFVCGATNLDKALGILRQIEEARANLGSLQERVQRVVHNLRFAAPIRQQRWHVDNPFTAGDEWDGCEFNGRFSHSIRLLGEQPLEVVAHKDERIFSLLEEAVIGRWGSDAWPVLETHAPVGGKKQ